MRLGNTVKSRYLCGRSNFGRCACVLLVLSVACGVATTASADYITLNEGLNNSDDDTGWFGTMNVSTRTIDSWTYGCDPASDTVLSGYRLADYGGGIGRMTDGSKVIYTELNGISSVTGLITNNTNSGAGYQRLYQSFTADLSTNILTFSLSKVYLDPQLEDRTAYFLSARMNISILEGEYDPDGTVVWSTTDNGTMALANVTALGYFDGYMETGWVNETVDLSNTLTGGSQYTLVINLGTEDMTGPGLAMTNVGIMGSEVPEPGTWAMLAGLGFVGAAWYRRRR